MYNLAPSQDENLLFFRLDGEAIERHGAVGYFRADFGRDGRGFFSKWFDSQPHLKTPDFKREIDSIVKNLRFDSMETPFASRKTLEAFCTASQGKELAGRGYGYMVQTEGYSYYFRCFPQKADYDIYCFAYDNRYLLPELAGQHGLPEVCYSTLPSSGGLISIRRFEKGYYPCDASKASPEENRLFADTSNKIMGITRAQEEAMLAGSQSGWDTPAAKPWNYALNGTPLPLPHKEKGHER